MVGFLKRLGFVLGVFFVMIQLISFGSLWALRQGSFYKPSFLINSVDAQNFDYIILGSSTGLTTLNSQVIDSIFGTNGLNLSMDDTTMSSHYLMLQHFLASGKSTKICILSPSITSYSLTGNRLSDNDYRFLPFVSKHYVSNYYHSFDSFEADVMNLSKWIPFAGIGYYNMELFYPSLISLTNLDKRNRFNDKGNYTYPVRERVSELIINRNIVDVEFNNPYLKLINDLCKTKNVQLVCYISPHESLKINPLNNDYAIINHSDVLENKHFFYDAIHVNSQGRQLVSERFANEFVIYLK